MPELADEFENAKHLVHALAYGAGKTKKTWWAGTAAEAGFNVTFLYCDREGGLNILKQIPPEARKLIRVIDIQDTLNTAVSAEFITRFCKGVPFLWDEAAKQMVFAQSAVKDDRHYVYVNPNLLNVNDVLVMDSWTTHVESMYKRFNQEHEIDPADAEKTEWTGYRWSGAFANWQLQQLTHLQCHLIVIGHQQYYEKNKVIVERKGNKKFNKTVTEWARTQPISTSGMHSQHVSGKFDDVFYFTVIGEQIKIDTAPNENRDSGSSIVPPGTYNWRDLTFDKVAEMTFAKPDPALSYEAFRFFKPGEEVDFEELGLVPAKKTFAAPQQAAPVLNAADAAKPTPANKGFAGLIGKGKPNG